MIIQVKSTKAGPDNGTGLRKKYAFEEHEEHSSRPYALGAALAAVVLYLRSFFNSEARASELADALEPNIQQRNADGADDTVLASVKQGPFDAANSNQPPLVSAQSGQNEDPAFVASAAKAASQYPQIRSSAATSGGTPASAVSSDAPKMDSLATNDNAPLPPRLAASGGAPSGGGGGGPSGGGGAAPLKGMEGARGEDPKSVVNRAPRAAGAVYLNDVGASVLTVIALSDLLSRTSDADGDALNIVDITASSGTLIAWGPGWVFQPQDLGPVTLTYRVTDGSHVIVNTAEFEVLPPTPRVGTAESDTITGSSFGDIIASLEGADTVQGGEGDDKISAGDGDDTVLGGPGDDLVYGGDGNDIVSGGSGNDVIFGGNGNDRLFGEAGDDTLYGEAGDDRLEGGAGNDKLHGGPGNDDLRGGDDDDALYGGDGDDLMDGGDGDDIVAGNAGTDVMLGGNGNDTMDGGDGDDLVVGEAGDDVIYGGDGDDTLSDGTGADAVYGGKGDDVAIAALGDEDDCYDGGEGDDCIDYSAATSNLMVDLAAGTVHGDDMGSDKIADFESVKSGKGNDRIRVDEKGYSLWGGEGDDVFEFAAPAAGTSIVQEIHDFEVGDRIKVSRYDIFKHVVDTLEDHFEDIYGESVDASDLPIRIQHERSDDLWTTIIEADFDGDQTYELTINIHGDHHVTVVENA